MNPNRYNRVKNVISIQKDHGDFFLFSVVLRNFVSKHKITESPYPTPFNEKTTSFVNLND